MAVTPAAPRCGILLVNLGTPDAPTPAAVRRYLAEFLADGRVVEVPRPLWLALLYLVILPLRSPRVARNYAKIWTERGSPLRFHTEDQARALGQATGLPVVPAFRYGQPSMADGLAALREAGAEKIIVLPMYPQNSATTTATIVDKLAAITRRERAMPSLQFVAEYPTHPLYINALAARVRAYWQEHGRGERLLLSFHGLPQRNVDLGDPYQRQCEATAQALAQALELEPGEWQLCYQSRFGAGPVAAALHRAHAGAVGTRGPAPGSMCCARVFWPIAWRPLKKSRSAPKRPFARLAAKRCATSRP